MISIEFAGSKNQDTGNTSGADQSPNGFNDQPDPHEMALQNHNLLIALGAARQAGSTGAQHFAMPVSIDLKKKCTKSIEHLHTDNVDYFCFNFTDTRHISLIRISCEHNSLAILEVKLMRTTTATIHR